MARIFSFRANGPNRLELFRKRAPEIDTLKVGHWVKNSILLTDLGFYKFQGFARIEENRGHYLTRPKESAYPTFVWSFTVHGGGAIALAGRTWKEVAPPPATGGARRGVGGAAELARIGDVDRVRAFRRTLNR